MLRKTLFAGILSIASATAAADVIDFVELTEGAGQLGESAWTSLNVPGTGFNVSITGTKNGNAAFAYLDWRHAGLGVCGAVYQNADGSDKTGANSGSSTNVCNPGSDDNVTTGEVLSFVFDTDVLISKLWLNNTHDSDFTIGAGDLVDINGNATAGPGNGYATGNAYNGSVSGASVNNFLSNGGAGYFVSAGTAFTVGFNDQQFYISGMEVTAVPAPGTLVLLGLGLIGVGAARRKRSV